MGIKDSIGVLFVLMAVVSGCQEDESNMLSAEEGEQFSGGSTTTFDESVNAFGNAAPNLTGDKDLFFVTGNSLFKVNWVTAPSSTSDLDGLGPVYNSRSCSGCHLRDGRGAPPLGPSEDPVSLLFRLSRPGQIEWEPIPDENYGGQFNHLAVLGVEPEGEVRVTYEEMKGQYNDGSSYSLRKPTYTFQNLKYGEFAPDMMISPRIAPHMVGLGLLEAIEESTLVNLEDPNDENGDGISGKIQRVWNVLEGRQTIGRFGWKAGQPTVRQQVAAAFRGDIGITSKLFPDEPCGVNQVDCLQAQKGGEPELTDNILDRVTLYSAALAVPRRRDWEEPNVLQGKALFNQIGCNGCHIPKLVTNTNMEFEEFSNQTIRPYTDLLLHDMGTGLADNSTEGLASGTEWRTPPLWGLGLIAVVNGHTFLLHDGRARNAEEAILWHGGEAQKSKDAFTTLTNTERSWILDFLNSL